MLQTISARDFQRSPKKIISDVHQTQRPIVLISHNKPQGAFISMQMLAELREGQRQKQQNKSIQSLREIAGSISDPNLPKDLSVQHDTYAWE